jgi:hypothetical protein
MKRLEKMHEKAKADRAKKDLMKLKINSQIKMSKGSRM